MARCIAASAACVRVTALTYRASRAVCALRRPIMRQLYLSLAAVIVLAARTAHAQEVTGDWQGILTEGTRTSRLLLHVSSEGDGHLSAALYNLDQGASAHPPSPSRPPSMAGSCMPRSDAVFSRAPSPLTRAPSGTLPPRRFPALGSRLVVEARPRRNRCPWPALLPRPRGATRLRTASTS